MPLKKSILDTLNYSAIFNFPLTAHEVYKYFISHTSERFADIFNELEDLVLNNKIKKVGDYYLPVLGDLQWVKGRQYSNKLHPKILKQVEADLSFLNKIPFIQLIAVTGSVGAKNIKEGFDIDLLFITKAHTIWITRFIVVLFFKFKKMYKNVYCPNIYLSQNHLQWETKNIYIANEIARLTPIYNKQHTYEKFLLSNKWILNYLPNLQKYFPKHNLDKNSGILHLFLFPFEVILFTLQYLYMKPKITSEKVNYKKIMFLKNDYKDKILNEFKEVTSNQ